jgi:hypothetical protein
MAGCTHQNDCALFDRFAMSSSLKIWRLLYCDTDGKYVKCARFEAARQGLSIPANLLPNGETLKIGQSEDKGAS